jgi:hypothetical protein
MPYTTCYVDLYDNKQVTTSPDIIASVFTAYGPSGVDNPYAFKPVNNKEQYSAFLHNPFNSGKILKIKNFEFKHNPAGAGASANLLIIGRASGISTGSVEPYAKLDTNSPNLPNNVGLTLSPLTTYTAISGSFRQKFMPKIAYNSNNPGLVPQIIKNNANTFYESQKVSSTIIQDLTLNPNEHLMFSFSNTNYPNSKYQISISFISGSNTYYQDATTTNTNFFFNASNVNERFPAAFVNNSNTSIKIQKIEVNHLYNDFGYYAALQTNGTWASKQLMVDHVKNDRLPQDLYDYLINSDTYDIVELDSNNSIPQTIKCYKNSVQVSPSNQFVWGDNITEPITPIYLRTNRFNFGNFTTGLTANNGLVSLHFSGNTLTRYDYHYNTELIINPGEGLGFLHHNIAGSQDAADGAQVGHITFTVEDVPTTTTVTETGFGY